MIDIIKSNEAVFIGSQLGLEYLSPYQQALLADQGIDVTLFGNMSDIDKAYYFGIMSEVLGGKKSYKVKKGQFDDWFKKELKKPLSTSKKEALDFIKQKTSFDLQGLGNKVTNNLTNNILTVNAAQRNKIRKKVKKVTKNAVKDGNSMQQLASDLRRITEDWARDFSRIAYFVMQEAYGYGRAQQILEDYGPDVEVYKQTFPGVCTQCEANYGTPDEEPIVYKLADLIANGNNIGKKTQDPVVGPAHPWARSILHVKPPNSVWDSTQNKFIIVRNTQGIKRNSKVQITITS